MASLEKPTGNYVQPESTLKAADTEAENNSQVAELERNVTTLKESLYLTGWRLHLMTFGLCLTLYLVNLEVTIISTSILSITNELHGYSQTGWILTGYLLTYTGFIIIWSKLSDIIGRKSCIMGTFFLFIIFSAGCGAAQTINQLIICRVFQGVGAAGGFSLTIIMIAEMVPKAKYAMYGALMAADMALATLSGPLLGGLISSHSQWRWVFLLNVPVGVVALIILFIAIPVGFPYHKNTTSVFGLEKQQANESVNIWTRLDLLGAVLLLAASLLLTTGLLEGGIQWLWSSGTSISILVISGVLWIVFFWWERKITSDTWKQEPIFPWRFLKNRVWMGVLMASLLNGVPFYILVICIPQRFQTINSLSPFQTGVRLLPLTFLASLGGILANVTAAKARVPPIYIMWTFSALTTIGCGLLTTLPATETIPRAAYGYMTLAGLGLGATFSISVLVTPFVAEARDLATATGALIEFRILGGALGLAIVTSAMDNYLQSHLPALVSPEQLTGLLRTTTALKELSPEVRMMVLQVFSDGYNLQIKITTAFAAAQILAIGLMWKKDPIVVVE